VAPMPARGVSMGSNDERVDGPETTAIAAAARLLLPGGNGVSNRPTGPVLVDDMDDASEAVAEEDEPKD